MEDNNFKNDEVLKEEETVVQEEVEELENSQVEILDEEEENSKEIKELQNKIKDLEAFNKKLKEDNSKASNELETYKDRLLRTNAEYENFRKRTSKEKEGIYADACADVLKNIFPVLDNIKRASEVDGSVEDIKKGIEMTMRQFNDALDKLEVEEISTDGKFDPNFHNAVMHIDSEEYGENEIVEVFQKGYKKGEKVLRYSMVKVAN